MRPIQCNEHVRCADRQELSFNQCLVSQVAMDVHGDVAGGKWSLCDFLSSWKGYNSKNARINLQTPSGM